MVRIGLIGASRIATTAILAPARTLDGVLVTAVAARDPIRAEAYARAHGIDHAVASYDALLRRDDIDLVYIATPPSLHAPIARAALLAGKAVLVEKPFTLNAEQARDIVTLAEQTGGHIFEAMHSLHHVLFKRLRAILETGSLGQVRWMKARLDVAIAQDADDFRWTGALGGGALMDLGVYPIAWCRYVAGNVLSVDKASARWRGTVDMSAQAALRFANGVTAEIACAMDAPFLSSSLLIEADHGHIHIDNPLVPYDGHRLRIIDASGDHEEQVDGPSTYAAQLRAVCDTMRTGAPYPLPSMDPLRSMEAIDLVRAAMQGDHMMEKQ